MTFEILNHHHKKKHFSEALPKFLCCDTFLKNEISDLHFNNRFGLETEFYLK